MAVGRISGPLLKANLLRDGVDLAFENDLLYLDVINGRIGVKTSSPAYDLDINGTTRTTNLIVDTQQVGPGTFTISGSTIASSNSTISLEPASPNAVVYQGKLVVDDIQVSTNTIEITTLDTDLEFNTLGTGKVNVNSNMLVNGDLHATGNITADGDITIGDTNTDGITFNADVTSNIIPDQTNTYDLGSDPTVIGGKAWKTVYANSVNTTNITANAITVNGIDLILPQGNIIYVAKSGLDTNAGLHENNPVLTIKHALSLASTGDTVYVYAGTYDEVFPLTIPVGVTVKGAGVRATIIQPTVGTITQDAFLLNGETTVEDLTIQGFRFSSGTGYAFRFATNFTVTSRSPYIRNVTVITRGSVTNSGDPYGFDSDDAGKGVLADGSVANASSKEAAMLFHSVTFFTPNQECVVATNGVRIEWLNSFAYFAEKGIYAYSSSTGFAGAGLTRLRINSQTGTWAIGNTVTYYDTDGTTVLGTGTIASKTGDFVNLTGRCLGFETITDRVGKQVYPQGGAKLSTTQKKFGTASLTLDGVGDYLTVATQPDFAFGTDSFCIEMWVYRTGNDGVTQILADFRTASPQVVPVLLLYPGTYVPTLNVNGTNVISGTTTVPLNTWTHIAVAKSGTSTKIFMNGVQEGSTYTDANDYIQGPLTIGARFDGTTPFAGYIDDVRISKGVARYTGTFTAPTAPLVGDLNTVLLLHFNGTNNSTTILDDGVTLQDLRTSAGGTASLINFADYSDFGAEIRSIGSANVYGTYGVYGDGIGVIAYLISENFAYVGAGKLTTNDPNDRIAANEVVELNGARIYYTSVDNEGNFKVGDNFYVNQKTGEVLFNGQATTITSLTGVTFTDGVHTTTITSTDLTTGNIRISGNTIESLTGDVNVTAASGSINLQNNTYVTGNLDVTGDVNIGGNIQIGDASTDTVNFVAGINSNLIPATTASYDLGTLLLRWNNAFLSRVEIDSLVIDSNTISTTAGNDDLQLIANGTGRIYIPSNDLQVDQNLTVTGDTSLRGTGITGTLTQTGNVIQTGDYTQVGNSQITGNLTVSTYAQFEKIRIDSNVISTTATNTDLKLEAAGTGRIYVPSDNVLFNQDLTVNGIATIGTLNVTGTVQANIFTTGDIKIDDNYITTTITDHNLELRANGTGEILIPNNNVQINNNLTVTQDLTVTTGTTYLKATGITGDVTQTGDINQTGNLTTSGDLDVTGYVSSTGYLQLPQVRIENNVVSTTVTNTDLQLQANGAGNVVIEGIKVSDNNIQSVVTNSNITLTPQGTGSVIISSNQSIQIPVGDTASRPFPATNGMIRYNTDLQRYEGYNGSYWLTLSGVQDADGNTKILAEATPGANDNTLYFYADGNLTATIDATKLFTERLQTSNLDLNGNTIKSITTDTDLNLTATGTGAVRFGNLRIRNNTITNISSGAVTEFVETGTGYVKIAGTNGVVIPAGDGYLDRPLTPETGMMRFNTDAQLVEVYNGVTWGSVAGASGGVTTIEATDLGIAAALIFG